MDAVEERGERDRVDDEEKKLPIPLGFRIAGDLHEQICDDKQRRQIGDRVRSFLRARQLGDWPAA